VVVFSSTVSIRLATLCVASLAASICRADIDEGPLDSEAQVVERVEAQLSSGEFTEAALQAQDWILRREHETGRYDIALAQPLTLLGDARMELDDPRGALEAYDRAKHITRLADGIQGIKQIELLHREATAFSALKEFRTANFRHEQAYDLSRRTYGMGDPRHLAAARRLIAWYGHHHKYVAAHLLSERLIENTAHLADDDPVLVDLLREQADLMRQKVFGRRKVGRGTFYAWPPGIRRLAPWREFSPFDEGEEALGRVVEIHESSDRSSDGDLADAMLDLADWHLLFGDYPTAVRNYRRVWDLLDSDQERRSAVFADPTPLYLPLPYAGKRDPSGHDGIVRLALTVTHRGRVVGRKTLLAEPGGIMEFRVRKAARRARYRPAFQEGHPVRVKGFPLEYTYNY